jgi:hypothetical protein
MHRPLFRITALIALMAAAASVSAGPPHGHRGPYHERGPAHEHRLHVRPGAERHRATTHRDRRAHRYAGIAVDQARAARRLGWYPDHPRWSLNYERHLRWALGHGGWRLEREIRKRAARLRELRMHHHGRGGGRVYRRW